MRTRWGCRQLDTVWLAHVLPSANAEPDDTDSFSASLGGMARSMRDSANKGNTDTNKES